MENSPSATSLLRASLSGQNRNSGDNFRQLLDDPFVLQLLTENELMLTEIDVLRTQLRAAQLEVRTLREQRQDSEALAIREAETMLMQTDELNREVRERDDKKVSLLRPILDSLVRLHFSAPYLNSVEEGDTAVVRTDLDSALSSSCTPRVVSTIPRGGCETTPSAREVRPATLDEANAQFVQLYRLVSSYQCTPSFVSSPYDGLVLDALAHIICLSKSMNALVFANAERDNDFVTANPPEVHATTQQASSCREQTPRQSQQGPGGSQSVWCSIAKKLNPSSRPSSRPNSRPSSPIRDAGTS